jgi:cullin-4
VLNGVHLFSECGSQFTFKLEGMFKDMAVSKDLMLSYKERESEGVDLSVTVLTTGYWPSYPTDSVIIPAQVRDVVHSFLFWNAGLI